MDSQRNHSEEYNHDNPIILIGADQCLSAAGRRPWTDVGRGGTRQPCSQRPSQRGAGDAAATITVTNLNDGGAGSLRQAIANAVPGDTVNFGLSGTIYLNSELTIDKALTIDGSGQSISISGDSGNNGSSDVRVFDVWSSGALTLNHMSVIKGTAAPDGGGAYVEAGGSLVIQDSTFTGNTSGRGRRRD